MIVNVNGGAAIGLNTNLISNYAEETFCMVHEMGHFYTSAYYELCSPLQLRSQAEYKADTWMINRIIPIDDLHAAIEAGYTEVWELAEYFDVPEKVIIRADEIYRNKCLL
jgi:Zn-dependent peptidase ImmA (M78 family)